MRYPVWSRRSSAAARRGATSPPLGGGALLLLLGALAGCSAQLVGFDAASSTDLVGPAADLTAIPDEPDLATPDLLLPDLTVGPSCGTGYCRVGDVCEVDTCHPDCAGRVGAGSVRCGDSTAGPGETCCKVGEVCHLGACTRPGRSCAGQAPDGGAGLGCATSACPDGEYCEASLPGGGRCLPLAQTNQCEYKPPIGAFSPRVKWEWQGSMIAPTYNQVMMTPMVGDLDGDCMPDVVFATFAGGRYQSDGVLRAVRGDGQAELWSATDAALRVIPGAQVALADVDGDGKLEVFACHEGGALMALKFDGTRRWLTTDKPCRPYDAPLVADLDHDGTPEVVVGFDRFNAVTGARVGAAAALHPFYSSAAELDGNEANGLELVGGGVALHADGSAFWATGAVGFSAVADLDGDGGPDVVSVSSGAHSVTAYRGRDGTVLWGPVDVNNGVATPSGPNGGGPPTIADFDGDGRPDVATAGGYGYLVLNGRTGAPLWQNTATRDYSSRVTGSSVFDFEGDGAAEAVYNDELNMRVYRGRDGTVLVKLCSTSGTLYENPVIVDVDADDHAEIVVMNNNYAFKTCDADTGGGASHTGFKVIGDAQNRWVRTRRLWNQHSYHVTNIGDDGKVPRSEPQNWKQPGLNNFRQNVQTRNLFAAPDLVPRDLRADTARCQEGSLTLVVSVLNQGAAGAPAGVPVTFYEVTPGGNRQVIGTVKTSAQILPGASQVVSLPWQPAGGPRGPFSIVVVVDEDGAPGSGIVNECDESNNTSKQASVGCPQIG